MAWVRLPLLPVTWITLVVFGLKKVVGASDIAMPKLGFNKLVVLFR